jgi:hypothetical protein
MIDIYDCATDARLGSLSQADLTFLVDQLEEESVEDQDYYISEDTCDSLLSAGAPNSLMTFLRSALAGRPEMDIRWELPQ